MSDKNCPINANLALRPDVVNDQHGGLKNQNQIHYISRQNEPDYQLIEPNYQLVTNDNPMISTILLQHYYGHFSIIYD